MHEPVVVLCADLKQKKNADLKQLVFVSCRSLLSINSSTCLPAFLYLGIIFSFLRFFPASLPSACSHPRSFPSA